MMKNFFWPMALILILFSVNISLSQKNSTYWINSMQTECNKGAGQGMCILVQKSETIDPNNWQLFYATIEGFEYEPGFFQKVELREDIIPENEVAADASNIKFTMIRQIEKVADPIWEINGEWVVQKLLGEEIDQQGQLPTVIINLNEMRVSGTNGCNNYTGSIKFISSDTFSSGPMASTRKMCVEMTIPDLFDKLFFIPWNYELTNDTFFIKDKEGEELMILKR